LWLLVLNPSLTGLFQDTDIEDNDDDGSTTVTNSTANLADLNVRPAPVPAEVLAVKLGFVATASIKETKSLPERPAGERIITIPPSDESATDLSPHEEPTTELGTVAQEPAVEEISLDVCTSEPSPNATGTIVGPVCSDEIATIGTGLETTVETPVEDDLPSQDDSEQGVEPWIPDYEIPTITISPPSEADPEDFTQQLDLEDFFDPNPETEHEQFVLPSSPVEKDDPWRSPKTGTGSLLWSDDESVDLGPLPFSEEVTHVEVFDNLESTTLETHGVPEVAEHPEASQVVKQAEADSPTEEGRSDTTTAASEGLNSESSTYRPREMC